MIVCGTKYHVELVLRGVKYHATHECDKGHILNPLEPPLESIGVPLESHFAR